MKIDAQAPDPEGLDVPGESVAASGRVAIGADGGPVLDPGLGEDLDLLMPRRRPWWVRIVVGMGALFVAGLLGWSIAFGYFYPRPEAWGSGSGSTFGLDPETGVLRAGEAFHNFSARSLEITDVAVRAPGGVEVLDVYLGPEEPMSSSGQISIVRDDASALVGSGSIRWILMEIRAESCPAPAEVADGRIDLTVRLSDPTFPPLSRVVGIELDGFWAEQACLQVASSSG